MDNAEYQRGPTSRGAAQMNKSTVARISTTLRRHDIGKGSLFYIIRDDRERLWVGTPYWLVQYDRWGWAPYLSDQEPGTYHVNPDGLELVTSGNPPALSVVPSGWDEDDPDLDVIIPLVHRRITVHDYNGCPVLDAGAHVLSVNLKFVSDMLGTFFELGAQDIAGRPLAEGVGASVRLTRNAHHPLRLLTVWRPGSGRQFYGSPGEWWQPIGIIVPLTIDRA